MDELSSLPSITTTTTTLSYTFSFFSSHFFVIHSRDGIGISSRYDDPALTVSDGGSFL
jgi:hypothetical protein